MNGRTVSLVLFAAAGATAAAGCDGEPSGKSVEQTSEPTFGSSKLAPDSLCTLRNFEGKAYWQCDNDRSASDARTRCKGLGFDLVEIENAAENAFVASCLGLSSTWLGGSDQETEGTWKWPASGVSFWQAGPVTGKYANWGLFEPESDLFGKKDCALMRPATLGRWYSNDCSDKKDYICEWQGRTKAPDQDCTPQAAGGHEYWFCKTPRTQEDAANKCRSQPGMRLVEIDGAPENALVAARVTGRAWLGGSDLTRLGQWVWFDSLERFWKGHPGGTAIPGRYANWNGGEPNETSKRCLVLDPQSGKWFDQACNGTAQFVCELGTESDDDNPFGLPPDDDCSAQEANGNKYWTCNNQRPFSEAEQRCRATGMELVRIDNSAENARVFSALTTNSWIGASDVASEGQWRWSSNQQLFWQGGTSGSAVAGQYVNWAVAQPNDFGTSDCGAMNLSDGGRWNDANCGTALGYVCEGLSSLDDCLAAIPIPALPPTATPAEREAALRAFTVAQAACADPNGSTCRARYVGNVNYLRRQDALAFMNGTLSSARYHALSRDRLRKLHKTDPASSVFDAGWADAYCAGDADDDLVPNARDNCPGTPPQTPTDDRGCPDTTPPLPTCPAPPTVPTGPCLPDDAAVRDLIGKSNFGYDPGCEDAPLPPRPQRPTFTLVSGPPPSPVVGVSFLWAEDPEYAPPDCSVFYDVEIEMELLGGLRDRFVMSFRKQDTVWPYLPNVYGNRVRALAIVPSGNVAGFPTVIRTPNGDQTRLLVTATHAGTMRSARLRMRVRNGLLQSPGWSAWRKACAGCTDPGEPFVF